MGSSGWCCRTPTATSSASSEPGRGSGPLPGADLRAGSGARGSNRTHPSASACWAVADLVGDGGPGVGCEARAAVLGAARVLLAGCRHETGNVSMGETDICGHRVGYNMLVSDARLPRPPVAVAGVTTGDVVALEVADCDRGIATELDPNDGTGTVVEAVHDAPASRRCPRGPPGPWARTLRISTSGPAGRTLLATVSVHER